MAVLFLAVSGSQAVCQTEISYVVPPTPVTFLTLVCLLGVPEGVPRWQSRAWPFSCPLTLPGPGSSLCGENIKKTGRHISVEDCILNCSPLMFFIRQVESQTCTEWFEMLQMKMS